MILLSAGTVCAILSIANVVVAIKLALTEPVRIAMVSLCLANFTMFGFLVQGGFFG